MNPQQSRPAFPSQPVTRRERTALFAIALGIVLGCLALRGGVLGWNTPHGTDAVSYHLQARLLASGRVVSPPTPLAGFFEMSAIVVRPDTRRFSMYTPGWPVLLAAATALGLPALANAVLAGMAAILIWSIARMTFGRAEAWTALGLTALSPFFLFMGASYLSHMSCATALLASLYCLLHAVAGRGRRTQAAWGLAAGAAAGAAMSIRPYSAFLGTLGAVWIGAWTAGWRPAKWLYPGAAACVGVLPFIGMVLLYNRATTGSALLFGYRAACPDLSFLGIDGNSRASVWENVAANIPVMIRIFDREFWGWFVPDLWAFAVFIVLCRGRGATWALTGAIVIFVVGESAYFFFDAYYGPRLIFESFPWIIIGTGAGLVAIWRRTRVPSRRRFGLWAAGLFVAANLVFALGVTYPELIRYYGANYCGHSVELAREAKQRNLANAVVFLDAPYGFEYGIFLPLNPLDIQNADVVFARYDESRIADFVEAYPRNEYWVVDFLVEKLPDGRNVYPDHFAIEKMEWRRLDMKPKTTTKNAIGKTFREPL